MLVNWLCFSGTWTPSSSPCHTLCVALDIKVQDGIYIPGGRMEKRSNTRYKDCVSIVCSRRFWEVVMLTLPLVSQRPTQSHQHSMWFGNILFVPRWRAGKESACQYRRCEFDPWIWGEIPWRRKWQPTPVFLPGIFCGQRSLVGCSPWGGKESDTAEYAHMHGFLHNRKHDFNLVFQCFARYLREYILRKYLLIKRVTKLSTELW